jgi:alkanesulfonate monooxygenase SsuD/methylene tetrahydromethanopterin reductase-like flavin-dependent oxidoreductase (luciferase family)
MKYAMFLPGGSPEALLDWAQQIEAAGFDSLWQGERSCQGNTVLIAKDGCDGIPSYEHA